MFGKTETKPDLLIFAVYDVKAENYRDPMFARQHWDIVRDYESMIRANTKDIIVTNAEDFQVFQIGTYERATGKINSTAPKHVINLHEVKASLLNKMNAEQQNGQIIPMNPSGH